MQSLNTDAAVTQRTPAWYEKLSLLTRGGFGRTALFFEYPLLELLMRALNSKQEGSLP